MRRAKIKRLFYLDTVGLQGFGVDIDQTVELTFTSLAFSVVSQSVIKIKKNIKNADTIYYLAIKKNHLATPLKKCC